MLVRRGLSQMAPRVVNMSLVAPCSLPSLPPEERADTSGETTAPIIYNGLN